MRSIVTVLLLAVLFIAGSLYFDSCVLAMSEEMAQKAQNARDGEDVRALLSDWEDKSRLLEIIVDHKEIDSVNQVLWTMEAQTDPEDFAAFKHLAARLFRHIGERNTLSPDNVF